jgi:hypothetical protein
MVISQIAFLTFASRELGLSSRKGVWAWDPESKERRAHGFFRITVALSVIVFVIAGSLVATTFDPGLTDFLSPALVFVLVGSASFLCVWAAHALLRWILAPSLIWVLHGFIPEVSRREDESGENAVPPSSGEWVDPAPLLQRHSKPPSAQPPSGTPTTGD